MKYTLDVKDYKTNTLYWSYKHWYEKFSRKYTKNKKIDVEYLFNHSFEPDNRYGPNSRFKHTETGYLLRIFRDEIVLDISNGRGSFVKKLVVSTVEELDLVIKWFKALKSRRYNDSNPEIEKLREELFKKLEEI